MYKIKIKGGKAFRQVRGKDEYEEILDLKSYLGSPIESIENTTFGQFMELVFHDEKDVEFYQLVFEQELYGHPLKEYLIELRSEPDTTASIVKPPKEGMWYLHIYWGDQFWIFDDKETGKIDKEIELHASFGGYGKWPKQEFDKRALKGGFGIEFTPLNELRDYELKIDEEVRFREIYTTKDDVSKIRNHFPKGSRLQFKFCDIIGAILDEITWGGTPKKREERREEFNEIIKRIDSGEEELVPFDK